MTPARAFKWLLVGLAAISAIVVTLHLIWPPPAPDTEIATPAVEAPSVKKVPKTAVKVAQPVKVYKEGAKANLKLPKAVIEDPNQHVIAATQVQPTLRPQTVTTVINSETGESESFVKQDAYPWLAVEHRGEIRIAYGYKFSHVERRPEPVARLAVGYDLLRVKALTAGVVATVDTDGDAFVGVGVAYKF